MHKEQANQKIIASIRNPGDLEKVLASNTRMVFLLSGDICQLEEQCTLLHNAGKQIFLHIDLINGLKGDESGIKYAAEHYRLAGIISTKTNCLKIAREAGLLAILRVFVIDSSALKTGIAHAKICSPHFVEVLPGISREIIGLAVNAFQVPVIAGGLISSKADVENAVNAGAAAVSVSKYELWNQ